jgi:arylsulfatase
MPNFDAIATPAVRTAAHLEPAFLHRDDIDVAMRKLKARKKKPNILIYLMDDVGWGDFGCYGGGVAVGAPTPTFDKLARQGLS